jgi:poly(3-hydroxybutyrate) depolymerase
MLPGLLLAALLAQATELPRGRIVPDVRCLGDPSQGYALYVPSTYSPDREWPVIFGFDPGGRGLNPVERYQAAAEKYGYIVAGSNNSRNGSWQVSIAAVTAMTRDVTARLSIAQNREYVAGMSGGSRVALGVALSSGGIAGVFASSAGYPDSRPRKELSFPVFQTAGTEDFNNLEMRDMDRELKSPHHLAIFEGGHTWLPPEVATEAVEWMEIQAMKSGRKARDQAEIDAIFAARVNSATTLAAVTAIAEDFTGLEDVTSFTAKAAQLRRDKRVREELRKQSEIETKERQLTQVIYGEATLLEDRERRADALKQLRERWKALSETAKGPDDTPERSMARRVLSGLSMGTNTQDEDYLAIIREYRRGR